MKRGLVLLAALGLFACEKSDDGSAVKTETASVKPAALPVEPAEPAEPEIGVDDVPTREDFEAEATAEITEDNFEQQLDDIEGEIERE